MVDLQCRSVIQRPTGRIPLMSPQYGKADIPQHLMVENTALRAADEYRRALIGDMTATIFKALKTYAIENVLQIGNLLWRQLRANSLKSRIRQGSSSR
ncbi:hypothetical protein [Agrobacterium sp. NPDC090273]|uniref:hypothetical protein n=1 Tax=Agrobacterium sp. NPDC090273 TaxID=3363919 RepID=UPI00383BE397